MFERRENESKLGNCFESWDSTMTMTMRKETEIDEEITIALRMGWDVICRGLQYGKVFTTEGERQPARLKYKYNVALGWK